MKIQCSCGAKYEFELTPAMSTRPVSFVCPVCGVDASDFVDSLVRRELGQSNSPSGPPVSITTETPGSATGSTGIPIEKHPPTALRITRAAPVATSQESEPDLTAQDYDAPVTCSRHPAEVAMAAATSRSPCSAAHQNAARRLASSAVNQSYASRCRGPSHRAMMSVSRPAK